MKRFWAETSVVEAGDGFAVQLDGKPIRTPAKAALSIPTRALAEAVRDEWQAQRDTVDPHHKPLTRYLNSSIDRVAPNRDVVSEAVAAYGSTDLICYRAERPTILVNRQAEAWDPLLDWLKKTHGISLFLAQGIMHVDQPPSAGERFSQIVGAFDPLLLAVMHELTALTGSLVIALAVHGGELTPDEAWARSRVDEEFQIEHWGDDEDAASLAASKRAEFLAATRLLSLLQS